MIEVGPNQVVKTTGFGAVFPGNRSASFHPAVKNLACDCRKKEYTIPFPPEQAD